jgi:GNAT superfamily N-acetyltransferase
VTCFVVRKGYRRRGITYALAAATVPYARANGARALEGYAMRTQPGREITWGELYVGAVQVFAAAGFTEVSSPSVRRAVMRVEFSAGK